MQILCSNFHTFNWRISWENLIKDQCISYLVIIWFFLISFSHDYVQKISVRRRVMLVTIGLKGLQYPKNMSKICHNPTSSDIKCYKLFFTKKGWNRNIKRFMVRRLTTEKDSHNNSSDRHACSTCFWKEILPYEAHVNLFNNFSFQFVTSLFTDPLFLSWEIVEQAYGIMNPQETYWQQGQGVGLAHTQSNCQKKKEKHLWTC